jgi:hypothetical protein
MGSPSWLGDPARSNPGASFVRMTKLRRFQNSWFLFQALPVVFAPQGVSPAVEKLTGQRQNGDRGFGNIGYYKKQNTKLPLVIACS